MPILTTERGVRVSRQLQRFAIDLSKRAVEERVIFVRHRDASAKQVNVARDAKRRAIAQSIANVLIGRTVTGRNARN